MQVERFSTPEMRHLENLLEFSSPLIHARELTRVEHRERRYPIYALNIGAQRDDVPVLAFIGGVHGVERIGSQVVLSFLETLIQRLQWDNSLIDGLENLRLLFVPIANPVGMLRQTRANGAGVDLMRNAPVEAVERPAFLVGGQRLSHHLPWYRGGEQMEPEAQALVDYIGAESDRSPFTLCLDVHSGFGMVDRLWFPYANSRQPVPHLAEYYAINKLMRRTYPHLDYVFEPQSRQYLTHGDLWDHLYTQALNKHRQLLPLTLEMGSWRWVKKNPVQVGKLTGLFNPVKPHRVQRVLRRHIVMMEFLVRATRSYQSWLPADEQRVFKRRAALRRWYENYAD